MYIHSYIGMHNVVSFLIRLMLQSPCNFFLHVCHQNPPPPFSLCLGEAYLMSENTPEKRSQAQTKKILGSKNVRWCLWFLTCDCHSVISKDYPFFLDCIAPFFHYDSLFCCVMSTNSKYVNNRGRLAWLRSWVRLTQHNWLPLQ